MAKFKNESGGLYVLPDGTEVKNGAEVNLNDDQVKNAGVAAWIKAKGLVAQKSGK